MTDFKALLWDIESSLMSTSTFSLWPKYIPYDAIIHDWHIICGAWKWLGKPRVYADAISADEYSEALREFYTHQMSDSKEAPPKSILNIDKEVTQKLRDVVAEADIVIHHNGDKFDLKKLNARCVYHGIEPFPKPKTVDTLKVAKREFAFTSNRLDYIGEYLGVGGKIHNEGNLWQKLINGSARQKELALRKMLKYNKRDVTLLEDVYLKMRPYIKNHPNMNLYTDSLDIVCPNCSGSNLQKRGYHVTLRGKYQRYQCTDCGAWTKGGKSVEMSEIG